MQREFILVTTSKPPTLSYESGTKRCTAQSFAAFFNIVQDAANALNMSILNFDSDMIVMRGNWRDEAYLKNLLIDKLGTSFQIASVDDEAYKAMVQYLSGKSVESSHITEIIADEAQTFRA